MVRYGRKAGTGGIPGSVPVGAILVGLLAGVGACGDRAREPSWTASVDTVGGIVRVTNTPPAGGAQPTLVGAEEWRVGSVEGEEGTFFGMIRSIAVLEDGRFAVGDAQAGRQARAGSLDRFPWARSSSACWRAWVPAATAHVSHRGPPPWTRWAGSSASRTRRPPAAPSLRSWERKSGGWDPWRGKRGRFSA
ncbi:MAG: hypothetical protein AMXMBFR53_19880 [Gemmatimonadota bacterium]